MLEIPMEVNRVTVQNVKNANEQPCRTEAKTCKTTRRDHRANDQYRVTGRNNNVRLDALGKLLRVILISA